MAGQIVGAGGTKHVYRGESKVTGWPLPLFNVAVDDGPPFTLEVTVSDLPGPCAIVSVTFCGCEPTDPAILVSITTTSPTLTDADEVGSGPTGLLDFDLGGGF
jgi:hypothetical protein